MPEQIQQALLTVEQFIRESRELLSRSRALRLERVNQQRPVDDEPERRDDVQYRA